MSTSNDTAVFLSLVGQLTDGEIVYFDGDFLRRTGEENRRVKVVYETSKPIDGQDYYRYCCEYLS